MENKPRIRRIKMKGKNKLLDYYRINHPFLLSVYHSLFSFDFSGERHRGNGDEATSQ